jgi:hypothetical protein
VREEFQPVVPKGLYKSVTQIFVKGKKNITITIFYTTFNCPVQGNVTQSWVETEFKLLNQKVQEFTKKGGNPYEAFNSIPSEMSTILNPVQRESIVKENKAKDESQTLNDSNCSIADNDIVEALHAIENNHIEQTLSLKNDVQSVEIANNFIVETLQKLCNKLDNLEDKIENLSNIEMTKRLGKLEEKVDNLIEKFEMSQKDYEHKMEKEIYEPKPKQGENDRLKLVDTIIELTSKISGIEKQV